jgi:hypothetical protein
MLEEDQLALTEWGWKTKARLRADVVLRRSYLFILPPTTWVVQPVRFRLMESMKWLDDAVDWLLA